MNVRFNGIHLRFDGTHNRFDEIHVRFDGIHVRFHGRHVRFDGTRERYKIEALLAATLLPGDHGQVSSGVSLIPVKYKLTEQHKEL